MPADQLRFFRSLHANALAAGVGSAAPEMRHFVRWVFAAVRAAARQNDATARDLLALAETAAALGDHSLRVYRLVSDWLGWRFVAACSERLRGQIRRSTGGDSLRQSWMNSNERMSHDG